MTYEEFKSGITALVSKPDTALAELPAFLEQVKADYETRDTSVSKVSEQEERIRTLQDTNMRLFLAQTGQAVEDKEEPELLGDDAVDAFVNDIMNDGSAE